VVARQAVLFGFFVGERADPPLHLGHEQICDSFEDGGAFGVLNGVWYVGAGAGVRQDGEFLAVVQADAGADRWFDHAVSLFSLVVLDLQAGCSAIQIQPPDFFVQRI
jgi:hypothetical protein